MDQIDKGLAAIGCWLTLALIWGWFLIERYIRGKKKDDEEENRKDENDQDKDSS